MVCIQTNLVTKSDLSNEVGHGENTGLLQSVGRAKSLSIVHEDILSDPKTLLKELLDGFAIAHGDLVTVKLDKNACRIQAETANKGTK